MYLHAQGVERIPEDALMPAKLLHCRVALLAHEHEGFDFYLHVYSHLTQWFTDWAASESSEGFRVQGDTTSLSHMAACTVISNFAYLLDHRAMPVLSIWTGWQLHK